MVKGHPCLYQIECSCCYCCCFSHNQVLFTQHLIRKVGGGGGGCFQQIAKVVLPHDFLPQQSLLCTFFAVSYNLPPPPLPPSLFHCREGCTLHSNRGEPPPEVSSWKCARVPLCASTAHLLITTMTRAAYRVLEVGCQLAKCKCSNRVIR